MIAITQSVYCLYFIHCAARDTCTLHTYTVLCTLQCSRALLYTSTKILPCIGCEFSHEMTSANERRDQVVLGPLPPSFLRLETRTRWKSTSRDVIASLWSGSNTAYISMFAKELGNRYHHTKQVPSYLVPCPVPCLVPHHTLGTMPGITHCAGWYL